VDEEGDGSAEGQSGRRTLCFEWLYFLLSQFHICGGFTIQYA
jgi:hypothetical protein